MAAASLFLIAILAAHGAPAATPPLDLRLDASNAVAGRPGPSIAAGLAFSSPLASSSLASSLASPLSPLVPANGLGLGLAVDVSAAVARDCLADGACVDPPKLSTNASLAFALGPVGARVGATLEGATLGGAALTPRIDASVALGFLAVETEGTSTMRLLASFDF